MGILLLIFGKVNIKFINKKLIWRAYKAVQILLITKIVEIMNKKKFVIEVLNILLKFL